MLAPNVMSRTRAPQITPVRLGAYDLPTNMSPHLVVRSGSDREATCSATRANWAVVALTLALWISVPSTLAFPCLRYSDCHIFLNPPTFLVPMADSHAADQFSVPLVPDKHAGMSHL